VSQYTGGNASPGKILWAAMTSGENPRDASPVTCVGSGALTVGSSEGAVTFNSGRFDFARHE
jgi:hypothetical protein